MKNGLLDIEQTENDLNVNNTSTTNSELKDSGLLGQITQPNQSATKNSDSSNTLHQVQDGLLNVKT